ncbi:MAG TPA: hypothetical protein VK731_03095 [Candidatus Cybelea sp.]|jgi:hypothetical protein|nr:hypothetical protein [Candidatus Cybelea sp.]
MANGLAEQVTNQTTFAKVHVKDTASVDTSFYYTDTIAADRQSRIFRALLAQ